MTQREIDRAVCRSTGEEMRQIQQRGFSLADPDVVRFDPEPDQVPSQMIDWDAFDLERNVALVAQPTTAFCH